MIRPVKKYVVEINNGEMINNIKIMSREEYLKLVRESHFLQMPKLLGSLNPTDKSTIEWEEKKVAKEIPERKEQHKFNGVHKTILANMIMENVDYLANKGVNNFVNNFNELIIKKL